MIEPVLITQKQAAEISGYKTTHFVNEIVKKYGLKKTQKGNIHKKAFEEALNVELGYNKKEQEVDIETIAKERFENV